MQTERDRITHLVVTCCTGFSAPGLDLELVERCGLPSSTERTIVGFMGCSAAINELKLARHIVRSEPKARVLVLNLELCSLHFQETLKVAQMLCFLLFADGCAASVVTAEPSGVALDSFRADIVPDSRELMGWYIGDLGFDMILSGQVPRALRAALRGGVKEILGDTPSERDRPLGGSSGRAFHSRCSRARVPPAANCAAGLARSAAPLWQYVVCDRDVCTQGTDALRCAWSARPCYVIWTRLDRGNYVVPRCR